jgi:hypothetical protein
MILEESAMHAACRLRCGGAIAIGILVLAAGTSAAAAVAEKPVDFERHVMGLFGRMGCNNGSCHGSFQGRGGLRLSLFGYDAEMDYLALTRDLRGRRIDPADPDASLILLKPTGQLPHEGLTRFGKNSATYRLLRDWIRQGAVWHKGSGTVRSLKITPPEYAFVRSGDSGKLTVEATFADGSTEDVTAFCEFRTNDDSVAEISPGGLVRGLQPGDAAVVVSYRGNVRPVRVLVPAESPAGFVYPDTPEVNFIDREVFAKLRRLNMAPSDLCSDSAFLRRVTLDTIGSLPTPEQVRAFLADTRPDKRARKIDELLAHPLHAALWATKFCDITGNNTDTLENPQQYRPRLSQMWYEWLRHRLADNVPYDEIVKGILCATTRGSDTPEKYLETLTELEAAADKGDYKAYSERPGLDLFWRRQAPIPIDQWGQKAAAAFLGVRLECAECHKHPFDRWTQADYRSFANVFGAVGIGVSPDAQKAFKDANAERQKINQERVKPKTGVKKGPQLPPLPLVREVFVGGKGGNLTDPNTNRPLPPKALGGPEISVGKGEDPRVALFDWMRSPDNPFFARSFANRVWGHYFGVGIVHPVDDFSLANPPSNEKLLNSLAREFSGHHYDIRELERVILNSRTYQLSHVPNATNRFDKINYARSYIRPLMAEVVVDMLDDALGAPETFGPEVPAKARAIEVGASRVQNGAVAYAFRIFGRPPRTTACDCERAMEPGLPQKLFLMADPAMLAKLKTAEARISKMLKAKMSDEEMLEELFLATLSRPPNQKERDVFAGARKDHKDVAALWSDTLWALVNTTEFIFNH